MYCGKTSLVLTLTALLALLSVPAHANQASELEQQLLQRIDNARAALQETQTAIALERAQYGERLQELQEEVIQLRQQVTAAQRGRNEELVALDELEDRLEQWQRQSNYQRHLIAGYADEFLIVSLDEDHSSPTAILAEAIDRLDRHLNPTWTTTEVLSSDGGLVEVAALSLGPVKLAYDSTRNSGGLLSQLPGGPTTMSNAFRGQALVDFSRLYETGAGSITFDPTLGSAERIAGSNKGIVGHIKQGGIWAIPILFFGFCSLLISIAKAIELLRMPKLDGKLAHKIQDSMASMYDKYELEKLLDRSPWPQRRLIDIAIKSPPSSQRDDLMVAYLMEHRHKMERFMGVVATSAAISPLLGLLGTVSGMINTFKMMTIFGSGDATTVSGGISEALVTTELGLIVAIPSLVVSALLTRKIKSYAHKMETFAIKLSKVTFPDGERS